MNATTIEYGQALTANANPKINGAETRRRAVESLYETSVEQIYKFIYFKVGNREDAEDLTSQVFIKAANLVDIEQDGRAQLAWLYQVARTTVTDFWRRHYKANGTSLDALEESGAFQIAAKPLVIEEAEDDDASPASTTVDALLAALPENYRKVLEYRFLKSYSLKETAAAMNITEANAKVIQHRALQKAAKLGAQFGVA